MQCVLAGLRHVHVVRRTACEARRGEGSVSRNAQMREQEAWREESMEEPRRCGEMASEGVVARSRTASRLGHVVGGCRVCAIANRSRRARAGLVEVVHARRVARLRSGGMKLAQQPQQHDTTAHPGGHAAQEGTRYGARAMQDNRLGCAQAGMMQVASLPFVTKKTRRATLIRFPPGGVTRGLAGWRSTVNSCWPQPSNWGCSSTAASG